jgi:hypothetical protein
LRLLRPRGSVGNPADQNNGRTVSTVRRVSRKMVNVEESGTSPAPAGSGGLICADDADDADGILGD